MKFFKVISILIIAVMLAGVVSASESDKISFEGLDFNIPDGFNQTNGIKDYNKLGSEGKTCVYSKNDTIIEITVIHDWMGLSLDELKKKDSTKATIKGHEGWKYKDDSLICFAFIEDDKGVIIGVSDNKLLSEIIT